MSANILTSPLGYFTKEQDRKMAMQVPGLSGHTTVLAGNSLVVYGGMTGPFQMNGETFALDLSTWEWTKLLCTGSVPIARSFHSAVLVGWRMYIFGGLLTVGVEDVHYNSHNSHAYPDAVRIADRTLTPFVHNAESRWPRTQQHTEPSSLHILDLKEKECSWITIPAIGFSPIPRAHHSACLFKEHMYVVGGYSVHGTGVLGDPDTHACASLHALNVDNFVWRRIETSMLPWPARWGSSHALAPNGKWYFSSGFNPKPKLTSNSSSPGGNHHHHHQHVVVGGVAGRTEEVFILDLKKREWKDFQRENPESTLGPRRAIMQASCNFAGRLYVHGGSGEGNALLGDLMALDEETGEWSEMKQKGLEIPTPRCGHTATVVGTELIIFGGIVGNNAASGKRVNDVFALNLHTLTWRKVNTVVSEFLRRSVLVPSVVDEALILDELPAKAQYSLDEIKSPGSTEYVPPKRKLPWDLTEKHVERYQHKSMDARNPLGTAVESAVESSLLDARQADVALRRSNLHDDPSDAPVILWGDESTKTAVATARSALTAELNLRVKRLDDFTAAASEGIELGNTLRSHFQRDVAPILRDSTKWREQTALETLAPRSDPFGDILFGFEHEVRHKKVTVDTKAMPGLESGAGSGEGGGGVIGSVPGGVTWSANTVDERSSSSVNEEREGKMRSSSYSTGLSSTSEKEKLEEENASQLLKPAYGHRYVSKSIRQLGLENHLKLRRGDAPIIEDAKEQMKNYLASRLQSRADYAAKKQGSGTGSGGSGSSSSSNKPGGSGSIKKIADIFKKM